MRYGKIENTDGTLTAYGFACGYVQVSPNGWRLYKDGVYHLQNNGEWHTFRYLTDARREFARLAKLG